MEKEKGVLGMEIDEVEVVIVNKQGFITLMPNLYMAKSYAEGLWKGEVDRIEVKQVYKFD
ncbi:hypothetical protein PQE68_gp049 [Bacillus phage vB_BanS_Sophrita]|uniref:Uncharacterized protein n=1 Tax=Bacillus phage vB_BanS_Sophrita TaxID=2894790 RepID=A0AAE9CDC6_9CAUD|nr:hypothetical protein PQE68_gp049 [Bacillus phage vB_BanS_Sophrita]UGO50640.1 hypothetical protein SOPHRITA_49 [Bacillus phage vB_BanS_Sophrita]